MTPQKLPLPRVGASMRYTTESARGGLTVVEGVIASWREDSDGSMELKLTTGRRYYLPDPRIGWTASLEILDAQIGGE